MELKNGRTERGFGLIEFRDQKNVECSIQQSSLATDECIWFGCDNADPHYFDPGTDEPWKKLEVPRDTVMNTRMHLNREQVAELIPVLQRFADSGELPIECVVGGEAESQSLLLPEKDELFDQAVEIVRTANRASTTLLQEKLLIGYVKSRKLIDQLEAHGIISPKDGAKPRKVL